ncbi:MAG: type II secretion system protein [Planctomycetota bacterium]|nr:type II secretion system protein [Planctomycetota bacterium]
MRAFTLIELIAVMVVLAVLAATAVPRYIDYRTRARSAAMQGLLGNVRTAIANFYANSSLTGTPAYPTLVQLTTEGTVVEGRFPANPYNSLNSVTTADSGSWTARTVAGTAGWRYYVDNTANPPVCGFYANSGDNTTVTDPAGGVFQANEL